ncbi:MAG TPA: hypothetical protein VLW55_20050 [Burkholderiaceae bacterium]|nr:hypothetical protein [Burkholderiaceae bacterium]
MRTNNGSRLTREYRQTLRANRERVFPLLCPEREKQWLPGWDARWIHSDSGFAERRAVFATRHGEAMEVIWVVAEHHPAHRVHFVRWHPDAMVVDIELDLSSPQRDTTALDVRYAYTATSEQGVALIEAMTLDSWHAQMKNWEDHLNAWLAAHPA